MLSDYIALFVLICKDLFFMNLHAKNVHVCLREQGAMRTVEFHERVTFPVNNNLIMQSELIYFKRRLVRLRSLLFSCGPFSYYSALCQDLCLAKIDIPVKCLYFLSCFCI